MVLSITGYNRVRKFTKIGWSLVLMGFIFQFYLWFAHYQDNDSYGQYFSYISFIEGCFALSGLLFYDVINKRGFHLKPKNFSQSDPSLVVRWMIILIGLALIQFTVQMMPLTVKDYEIALSIQFAGPSEEAFFRGVLCSIVIMSFHNIGFKIRIFKKEISIWELFGIILVSIGFATLHVNYYGSTKYMLGTFLCGMWLGMSYFYWEDLTACILAHSTLNFFTLIQSFWMVNF